MVTQTRSTIAILWSKNRLFWVFLVFGGFLCHLLSDIAQEHLKRCTNLCSTSIYPLIIFAKRAIGRVDASFRSELSHFVALGEYSSWLKGFVPMVPFKEVTVFYMYRANSEILVNTVRLKEKTVSHGLICRPSTCFSSRVSEY